MSRHPDQAESSAVDNNVATLFGHPVGLYTLFFAEMWERFSFYGMRALLILYMLKGFLRYGDEQAYTVYGAYTALVYMTPFIGGMLADRLLGQRLAVIIGGLLMASGHLLMMVEREWPFYFALALLISGNGFFKPNISTMVGSLYKPGSPKRDDGFNIFYMGINLGAAMSPLLCGYIGETYGWHKGFGLATIGMLVGLAVFVMPNRVTQVLILLAASLSAVGLFRFRTDGFWPLAVNLAVAAALLTAAVIAVIALGRGGLPAWAGARPERAPRKDWMVYLGIAIAIPVFALLVSGFSPFQQDKEPIQLISDATIEKVNAQGKVGAIAGVFLSEISKPAGLVLAVLGILAFGYLFRETFRLPKVPRERMLAALCLIFFQMLFFAFFEQAGSSVNNFTDRNVDRVQETGVVTEDMVGQTIRLQPTQEQLGHELNGEPFTMTDLSDLRAANHDNPNFEIDWAITQDNVGMGLATRDDELPASIFQAVNAFCILTFALVFNWIWSHLRRVGLEPSAPVKFALGLMQLGLGFGAFWLGAQGATDRGMVMIVWLLLGYVLHTTGELCLSPVGLSAMTKLSPAVLVSTLMGAWFLATAFSQYLAAIISQFTVVSSENGGESEVPIPAESLNVYGDVFGQIAVAAIISGLVCLALSPLLTRWMHQDTMGKE